MTKKQLWRHKPSGDVYAVSLEDERVVGSLGPVSPEDAGSVDLHGDYLSKLAELADNQSQVEWITANVDEFEQDVSL